MNDTDVLFSSFNDQDLLSYRQLLIFFLSRGAIERLLKKNKEINLVELNVSDFFLKKFSFVFNFFYYFFLLKLDDKDLVSSLQIGRKKSMKTRSYDAMKSALNIQVGT